MKQLIKLFLVAIIVSLIYPSSASADIGFITKTADYVDSLASLSFLSKGASCISALASCRQKQVSCKNSLQRKWTECGDKYEKAKDRCETYKNRALSLVPACEQKMDNCEMKAKIAKDPVKALAKCDISYTTCRQRASVRGASYFKSYDSCRDRAHDNKKKCEERFSYNYPKQVATCMRRADSCIKSVNRRCGN